MLAPICLFTYNRLDETIQTINALKKNILAVESDLIIFSDAPKNENAFEKVSNVRNYLKSVNGFKSVKIVEAQKNKGLAKSIINGASEILEEYGKIIVLEDDLITTPNFLDFMNQALDYYQDDRNIQSVNGFSLSISNNVELNGVYFQTRPFSWGWATWQDRWNKTIFDKKRLETEIKSEPEMLKEFKKACGDDILKMFVDSIYDKNDSWYVRWAYNHFKNNTYSVYPMNSLVENIGFGGDGVHCTGINAYKYKMDVRWEREFKLEPFRKPGKQLTKSFLNNFSIGHKVMFRVNLLGTSTGRRQVFSEFKTKLGKK